MNTPERRFWRTPAVRHLAWLCKAPTLIDAGPGFSIARHLPADTAKRLQALDQSPEPLLACLNGGQSQRLGYYFENLYHFLLTNILEWPVLLRNAPIRNSQGRTLGELDFIVRNPASGELQHHEIAVKFYLGYATGQRTLWYGPNAHDRLDLKTHRMLNHQCRMTERQETQALLAETGLHGPVTPAMIMPGNLFYPEPPGDGPINTPQWTHQHHERGQWLRHSDMAGRNTRNWTPLQKPHWLGPYQTVDAPDPVATEQALAAIAESGRPRLFAELAERPDGLGFDEALRCFVVPESWPEPETSPC